VDALSTPTVAPPLLFGALAPPGDLLPWAWAQQRRAAAGNYWILPGGPPTPPQQEGWEPIVTAVPSIVYAYHELLHTTESVAKTTVRQSDSRQRRRPHGARSSLVGSSRNAELLCWRARRDRCDARRRRCTAPGGRQFLDKVRAQIAGGRSVASANPHFDDNRAALKRRGRDSQIRVDTPLRTQPR
jgi:hypothetical protein